MDIELSVGALLKKAIRELNEDDVSNYCKTNEKELIPSLAQILSIEFAIQRRNNVTYYRREDWVALKKRIIQIVDVKRPHFRLCWNQRCSQVGKCQFTAQQVCECHCWYNTFCQRCRKFQQDDFDQHRAVCTKKNANC